MNYNHLTIEERGIISFLHRNNVSTRKIAETIERNPSTVSRELKRNFHKITGEGAINKDYTPALAQLMYKRRIHKAHDVLFYSNIVLHIIVFYTKILISAVHNIVLFYIFAKNLYCWYIYTKWRAFINTY